MHRALLQLHNKQGDHSEEAPASAGLYQRDAVGGGTRSLASLTSHQGTQMKATAGHGPPRGGRPQEADGPAEVGRGALDSGCWWMWKWRGHGRELCSQCLRRLGGPAWCAPHRDGREESTPSHTEAGMGSSPQLHSQTTTLQSTPRPRGVCGLTVVFPSAGHCWVTEEANCRCALGLGPPRSPRRMKTDTNRVSFSVTSLHSYEAEQLRRPGGPPAGQWWPSSCLCPPCSSCAIQMLQLLLLECETSQ